MGFFIFLLFVNKKHEHSFSKHTAVNFRIVTFTLIMRIFRPFLAN